MKKKPIENFVPKRYAVVNEELDNLKFQEVYEKLIKKLETDLREASDSVLRDLIISAPNDLRLAGYCYAIVKEDHQRILDGFDEWYGKYEAKAQEEISHLKKLKKWAGTTSRESVRNWVAQNVPASRVLFETVRKSERILKTVSYLYKAYESRLSSLQTYAKLIEKRRGRAIEEIVNKNK